MESVVDKRAENTTTLFGRKDCPIRIVSEKLAQGVPPCPVTRLPGLPKPASIQQRPTLFARSRPAGACWNSELTEGNATHLVVVCSRQVGSGLPFGVVPQKWGQSAVNVLARLTHFL